MRTSKIFFMALLSGSLLLSACGSSGSNEGSSKQVDPPSSNPPSSSSPQPSSSTFDYATIRTAFNVALYNSFGLKQDSTSSKNIIDKDSVVGINYEREGETSLFIGKIGLNILVGEDYYHFYSDTPEENKILEQYKARVYEFNSATQDYKKSKKLVTYPFMNYRGVASYDFYHHLDDLTNPQLATIDVNSANLATSTLRTSDGFTFSMSVYLSSGRFAEITYLTPDQPKQRWSFCYDDAVNFDMPRASTSEMKANTLELVKNPGVGINGVTTDKFKFRFSEFKPKDSYDEFGYWANNTFEVDGKKVRRAVNKTDDLGEEVYFTNDLYYNLDNASNISKVILDDGEELLSLDVEDNHSYVDLMLPKSDYCISTLKNLDLNKLQVSETDDSKFSATVTSGNTTYKYALEANYDEDVFKSFMYEQYDNNQLVKHLSWTLSDIDATEVVLPTETPKAMSDVIPGAVNNFLSTPHRFVLETTAYSTYNDFVEVDNSDSTKEILHLKITGNSELYLLHDKANSKYYKYVASGFSKVEIDESEYLSLGSIYFDHIEQYVKTISTADDLSYEWWISDTYNTLLKRSVLSGITYYVNNSDESFKAEVMLNGDFSNPTFTYLQDTIYNSEAFGVDSFTVIESIEIPQ